jgi:hypothetical protein
MPKVEYTPSRGLVQSSGSTFEVGKGQLKLSSETLTNAHIDIVVDVGTTAVSESDWNQKYIAISGPTRKYVLWVDVDSSTTQPTVPGGDVYIEVAISAADTATTVGAAIESAIDGNALMAADFTVYHNAGTLEIIGAKPFAMKEAASHSFTSAEAVLTTFSTVTSGSGNNSKVLSADYELSIIDMDGDYDAALVAADADVLAAIGATAGEWTLADGTYIGQRKTIMRKPDDTLGSTDGIIVTVGKMYDKSYDAINSTNLTFLGGAAVLDLVELIWVGNGWALLSGGAISSDTHPTA